MATKRSSFSTLSEGAQTTIAVLGAAAIFILALWVYSATKTTMSCHSKQGHIRIGQSVTLIVCSYHDGVPRG